MISYELAKRLKEEGFPQNGINGFYCSICKKGFCFSSHCDCDCMKLSDEELEDKDISIPNLEELIEACGDNIESLQKVSPDDHSCKALDGVFGGWEACSHEAGMYHQTLFMWGHAPEEAVAKLLLILIDNGLKLNKK